MGFRDRVPMEVGVRGLRSLTASFSEQAWLRFEDMGRPQVQSLRSSAVLLPTPDELPCFLSALRTRRSPHPAPGFRVFLV